MRVKQSQLPISGSESQQGEQQGEPAPQASSNVTDGAGRQETSETSVAQS